MTTEHITMCRFCHASCPIKVTVENGRATKIIGVKDNPMYFGYTCKKGRELPQQHYGPTRLLQGLKRQPDGGHAPIDTEQALDDIATRLQKMIAEHGPRSVAMYTGSLTAWEFFIGGFVANSFMQQIGSPMVFGPHTIDQPGKPLALALHGNWGGGAQEFDESDSWLLVGTNAAISKNGGIPVANPEKRLRDELLRGLKLIVIDPRRTETAEKAHIHIQPIPGEDPTILAGMIRIILEEKLYDADFVGNEAEGLAALQTAVAPFTPDYVAQRAKIPAQQIPEAARLYAAGRGGRAGVGTGPNMAPRGTLTEYLVIVLNTLVGAWHKAGDVMTNPGVLTPQAEGRAQALPRPEHVWGYGEKLRVRGLQESMAGMPTSALAEEILLEGEGQVRALFNLGGNPMRAWPDQLRTFEAMKTLELSVTSDIKMSTTAELSEYVLPPKLSLETPTSTLNFELLPAYGLPTFPRPYAQVAPAIVQPPEGADLLEEWELFYGLAQRMGLQLDVFGNPIDMVNKPTTEDLLALASTGSRIPFDEVKKYPAGHVFDNETIHVKAKEKNWPHRLDIGNPEMMAELEDVLHEYSAQPTDKTAGGDFNYRLVSRRMRDVYNSCGQEFDKLTRQYSYNPLFMHPQDMQQLSLTDGNWVTISSRRATIKGIVEADDTLRPGVVSMAHGWGANPDSPDDNPLKAGSPTSRLIDTTSEFEPRSGIPVMSALPVKINKIEANAA